MTLPLIALIANGRILFTNRTYSFNGFIGLVGYPVDVCMLIWIYIVNMNFLLIASRFEFISFSIEFICFLIKFCIANKFWLGTI